MAARLAIPADLVSALEDGDARRLPPGPDHLFCMIHGQSRDAVDARRAELAAAVGLTAFPSAVLFSTDCYKQCGARYTAPQALPAGHAAPPGLAA